MTTKSKVILSDEKRWFHQISIFWGEALPQKSQLASVPSISWRQNKVSLHYPFISILWWMLQLSPCLLHTILKRKQSQQSNPAGVGSGSPLSTDLLPWEILHSVGDAVMLKHLMKYSTSWNAVRSRCDLKQILYSWTSICPVPTQTISCLSETEEQALE